MFDLNTIWFILIAILWIGFFFLEGFDFGVGMLMPFLGKDDVQRQVIINTIGPHWDGNEVWLITAAGATFAAFPQWYATMFSGFYLAIFFILVGLIIRAVGIEFRSKVANPKWRALWDGTIFTGSLLPAFLIGLVFANLVGGVPIDAKMNFVGSPLTLLNPYGVLGGTHGSLGLSAAWRNFFKPKTMDDVQENALKVAKILWVPATLIAIALAASTFVYTDFVEHIGLIPGAAPFGAIATLVLVRAFLDHKREGWAFMMMGIHLVLIQSTFFIILFPRVMISSIHPDYSLTIYNASSSPYALQVMTIIGLIFLPIVLLYEGYTYWVFRKRLKTDAKELTY